MKTIGTVISLTLCLGLSSCPWGPTGLNGGKVADHSIVKVLWEGRIPETAIVAAKAQLHIGYGHTSHGSQISDGLRGLVAFANGGNLATAYSQDLFAISQEANAGALHLFEGSGYDAGLLQGDAGWGGENILAETREFLDDPAHADCNVIMWSWCGQVSGLTEQQLIDSYLTPMATLEAEYPGVAFVYMTGHLDGSGVDGNLNRRNEQIRAYCKANNKWLYDFADIESYDPDGTYYLDRGADDACNYDGGNWAVEWIADKSVNEDWYDCGAAHSHSLNANMKAYAAWWLFARMAGWSGLALD